MIRNIRYGLLLSAIAIAYFLTTNFYRVSGQDLYGWLGNLIFPVGIGIHLGLAKRQSPFTFLQGLKAGIVVSAVVAVASSLFMFLYLSFVSDFMIQNAIEIQTRSMLASDISIDEFHANVNKLKANLTPTFYLLFGIVSSLIIGALSSLVLSGILATKKTESVVE